MLSGVVVHTPTLEEFIKVIKYCKYILGLEGGGDVRLYSYKTLYSSSSSNTCVRVDKLIYRANRYHYEFYHNMNIMSVEEFFSDNNVGYKKLLKGFR